MKISIPLFVVIWTSLIIFGLHLPEILLREHFGAWILKPTHSYICLIIEKNEVNIWFYHLYSFALFVIANVYFINEKILI